MGAAAVAVDGEGPAARTRAGVGVLDVRGEGVDAGGAQPDLGPGVDVAVGVGGEGVDEVGE